LASPRRGSAGPRGSYWRSGHCTLVRSGGAAIPQGPAPASNCQQRVFGFHVDHVRDRRLCCAILAAAAMDFRLCRGSHVLLGGHLLNHHQAQGRRHRPVRNRRVSRRLECLCGLLHVRPDGGEQPKNLTQRPSARGVLRIRQYCGTCRRSGSAPDTAAWRPWCRAHHTTCLAHMRCTAHCRILVLPWTAAGLSCIRARIATSYCAGDCDPGSDDFLARSCSILGPAQPCSYSSSGFVGCSDPLLPGHADLKGTAFHRGVEIADTTHIAVSQSKIQIQS